MTLDQKLYADLSVLVNAAEKNGALNRLKSVAIYFDEFELRTIIHALGIVASANSPFFECPTCGGDIAGAGHIVSCINARKP